jgi:hypothetical protein
MANHADRKDKSVAPDNQAIRCRYPESCRQEADCFNRGQDPGESKPTPLDNGQKPTPLDNEGKPTPPDNGSKPIDGDPGRQGVPGGQLEGVQSQGGTHPDLTAPGQRLAEEDNRSKDLLDNRSKETPPDNGSKNLEGGQATRDHAPESSQVEPYKIDPGKEPFDPIKNPEGHGKPQPELEGVNPVRGEDPGKQGAPEPYRYSDKEPMKNAVEPETDDIKVPTDQKPNPEVAYPRMPGIINDVPRLPDPSIAYPRMPGIIRDVLPAPAWPDVKPAI